MRKQANITGGTELGPVRYCRVTAGSIENKQRRGNDGSGRKFLVAALRVD